MTSLFFLHFPEEAAADVEENRLEFVHGEKLCEVVVQKRICSFREEKVAKGIMMADMEQEEMMRL